MIGFKLSEEKLLENINKLTLINIETSFGSKLSKIDTYINKDDEHSFIRLAIGYDDNIERIKNGLNELFQNIN
jgi:hypothetical protein